MRNFFIYLAVIVSGASVLALEILGTRLLAPFYGSSIYLWSALIGVTLAALSLGYTLGGRSADRAPSFKTFSAIIGLAGLWIAFIPTLRTPALMLTESLGLRTAVLLTATVLFFPPLTLLGMISPYAIRLKVTGMDVVGRTAGYLYAISTVASVVAAILTGFVLIPNVGVARLALSIGVLLLVTALFGLLRIADTKGVKSAGISVLIAMIAIPGAIYSAPSTDADPERGLLAFVESEYAEVQVRGIGDYRYMLIDGGAHTVAVPYTWETGLPYVHVVEVSAWLFDTPGEMLLVGLGGGSLVKSFANNGWEIDAVEIDPVVTQLARTHFGLKDEEADVYNMDGRRFLLTHDKKYDLIVLDAFGSSSIPFHLVTEESFALMAERLAPAGALVVNIEAVGWDDIIVRSLTATLKKSFAYVAALPIAEPPDQLGNIILMASNRALELVEELPNPRGRFTEEYVRAHAWDNRFEADVTGVPVLTDDYNPIDVWTERVNHVARKQLHEFFSREGATW